MVFTTTDLRQNIVKLYGVLGADQGKCGACGRPIWWIITKNGKKAPYTSDGINHFADCPKADTFRNRKGR